MRLTQLGVWSVLFFLLLQAPITLAQTESASISGRVTDPDGAIVEGAKVTLESAERGTRQEVVSNQAGIYLFSAVRPGIYHITVLKQGFRQISLPNLTANVQAHIEQNFSLQVGATSESVTVNEEEANINTESGSVGTVIDSQFVSNLPLNGRTFQTLILLSPGVVLTPVNNSGDPSNGDSGQFSVNGMRANANYITVDGVSGNFGIGIFVGSSQSTSGSLPATNIQGSYSSLVSADALQEFKIQTSTFAPEFGRTPGAQISLVTKSGANLFHGSAYEYLRNDVTDAKDWFDVKKPPLRFNDFGADFSGPVWKNKTFFFFSYEGQRFLLPQPTIDTVVPSLSARQGAPNPIAQALLDAFPSPNGPVLLDGFGNPTGAIFHTAYSNPNHSDSYSLRIDHNFNSRFSVFARYNQSPSDSFERLTTDLATAAVSQSTTRTATLGSSQLITNSLINELRLNASEQVTSSADVFAPLSGAREPDANIFLPGLSLSTSSYDFGILSPGGPTGLGNLMAIGNNGQAKARSINVVDNLSYTRGKHAMKFGFDYRWYSPVSPATAAFVQDFFVTSQDVYNAGVPGNAAAAVQIVNNGIEQNIVVPNYSVYGQDTWSVTPRLTVTYGLRWEINPAPHARDGDQLLTLSAPPDLSTLDQSGLQLAPIGTPYYKTEFDKFAPRVGVAYQLRQQRGRELVVRGGWGLFYDLNSTPFASASWPYLQQTVCFIGLPQCPNGNPVPVPPSAVNFPPPNFTPSPSNPASVDVAGKGFTLPRVYQWNLTLEQSLGVNQAVSLAYVASAGRKLLRSFLVFMGSDPNSAPGSFFSPNFNGLDYTDNASYSDYNSLQAQYRRNLAKGLQVIANYTWSHSTDDVSTTQKFFAPGLIYAPSLNHGASTFDVRHSFTAAVYYEIPSPTWNRFAAHILGNWDLSDTLIARTGLPFDIEMSEIDALGLESFARRPNVVPGVPLIVSDSTAPGGRRLNTAVDANGNPLAFTAPPGNAQGDMGRNSLYGFGAWQSDLAIHRKFKITERVTTEFRFEAFNFLNHPNFMNPNALIAYDGSTNQFDLSDPTFGRSLFTMARGFNSNFGGGLNPLFQIGGPRDMQLSLRVSF